VALAAPAGASALASQVVRAADGSTITVEFSDAFAANERPSAQAYADYLGTLPHGAELAGLTVRLARGLPDIVKPEYCGESTNGCYDPAAGRIAISATARERAVSNQYWLAHEYGHRVAAGRPGYMAGTAPDLTGPARWASHFLVCAGLQSGSLSTDGDYQSRPGENWAETYARLTFPAQPWSFDAAFTPDPDVLELARSDVLSPYTGPKPVELSGRFSRRGSSRKAFSIPVDLDGPVSAKLSGSRALATDMEVTLGGRHLGSARGSGGSNEVAATDACRSSAGEALKVTVKRRRGAGAFRLTVTRPAD
jgi:hypothetical protein